MLLHHIQCVLIVWGLPPQSKEWHTILPAVLEHMVPVMGIVGPLAEKTRYANHDMSRGINIWHVQILDVNFLLSRHQFGKWGGSRIYHSCVYLLLLVQLEEIVSHWVCDANVFLTIVDIEFTLLAKLLIVLDDLNKCPLELSQHQRCFSPFLLYRS